MKIGKQLCVDQTLKLIIFQVEHLELVSPSRFFMSCSSFLHPSLCLVPPNIVAHSPEHLPLVVREGRDARFSCRAVGRPTPLLVWHVNGLSRPGLVTMGMSSFRRQGNELTSCQTYASFPFFFVYLVAGHNESVLILRNVSRFDSGRVDCSASNHLSTVNRQFLLQVTCQ